MPTQRIRRDREPVEPRYTAQFSVMMTPEHDTVIRTIKRHRKRSLSDILREAAAIGLDAMVARGDLEPPAKVVRKSARARKTAARAAANGGE